MTQSAAKHVHHHGQPHALITPTGIKMPLSAAWASVVGSPCCPWTSLRAGQALAGIGRIFERDNRVRHIQCDAKFGRRYRNGDGLLPINSSIPPQGASPPPHWSSKTQSCPFGCHQRIVRRCSEMSRIANRRNPRAVTTGIFNRFFPWQKPKRRCRNCCRRQSGCCTRFPE